jgi:hypothetical protein
MKLGTNAGKLGGQEAMKLGTKAGKLEGLEALKLEGYKRF